jgi:phytoene dehydrogenase-like protein
VVFIFTFDHDPGRLSAAFAHQRLRRGLAGGARYVTGGWSTLAGLLAERAGRLGAQLRTQTRVPALPAGPTILATSLAAARQLTGDGSLALRTHCTGAIDVPGTTWHDRPAVSRGNTLTVATDQSAAPGLLAEVGITAAQLAVQHLSETPRPTPAFMRVC